MGEWVGGRTVSHCLLNEVLFVQEPPRVEVVEGGEKGKKGVGCEDDLGWVGGWVK